MTLGYLGRRVGLLALVVFAAVSLNFFIPRLSPVDPITARLYELAAQGGVNVGKLDELIKIYEGKFGLDKPIWEQYLNYWINLAHLDLGVSFASFSSVRAEVLRALPWTIGLLAVTTFLAFTLGTLAGALLAWPRMRGPLQVFVPMLMTLSAVPFYLLGILLIFVFALTWPVLPTAGAIDYNVNVELSWPAIKNILRHAVLPSSAILLSAVGFWGLGMRGTMITTMGEDYMKLAEYKGLKEWRIFLRYAVRNAMLPQVTALGISLAQIMGGAVLVETIFAYPGVGYLLFQAIGRNDFFMIQGIVFFIILAIAVALLIIDLIYPLLDPRIRTQRA